MALVIACGILVPQPGIKPRPPALGAGEVLATGPQGKSPRCVFELWFSPGICPGVGLLAHVVVLFLVLFFFFSSFFFFFFFKFWLRYCERTPVLFVCSIRPSLPPHSATEQVSLKKKKKCPPPSPMCQGGNQTLKRPANRRSYNRGKRLGSYRP